MQENNTTSTNKDKEKEVQKEISQLVGWVEHFSKVYKFSYNRKERCECLMKRRSSKKWSPEKTAKMVRRLMTANKELEQSESTLDNCQTRLSRLGVEVNVVSRNKLFGQRV